MKYNICFVNSLILLILSGCQTNRSGVETSETTIPVNTATVQKRASSDEISLSGNIEGFKTVRLGFMVAGKVDFIAADEGQVIHKGQLISSIDPASYNFAKELADIQVNQVQDEYDRLKLMHDSNSLSESDFAKISFGLQQAKVQQKLHTKNLSDTKLYSPIEGILLKKLAEVGEITGVGMPLFVVSDIRKVKVNAFIPENELHNIKIGETATVQVSSMENSFEGRIIEVGSAADPASRTFSVKIESENPDMLMRPGMIAEVKIESGRKKEVLVIPIEAIQHDYNDQSFVYVLDSARDRVFRRNVYPGNLLSNMIEIVSGLTENEIIITGGQQKLIDGSLVIINK